MNIGKDYYEISPYAPHKLFAWIKGGKRYTYMIDGYDSTEWVELTDIRIIPRNDIPWLTEHRFVLKNPTYVLSVVCKEFSEVLWSGEIKYYTREELENGVRRMRNMYNAPHGNSHMVSFETSIYNGDSIKVGTIHHPSRLAS